MKNNFYTPFFDKENLLTALKEIKQFNKKQQDIFLKFESDKMLIIADKDDGRGTCFKLETIKFDGKRPIGVSYSAADKSGFYRINLKHLIYFINEVDTDYIQILIETDESCNVIITINRDYLLKSFKPVYTEVGPSGCNYSTIIINRLNYIINHPELSK